LKPFTSIPLTFKNVASVSPVFSYVNDNLLDFISTCTLSGSCVSPSPGFWVSSPPGFWLSSPLPGLSELSSLLSDTNKDITTLFPP